MNLYKYILILLIKKKSLLYFIWTKVLINTLPNDFIALHDVLLFYNLNELIIKIVSKFDLNI